jgi:hypothetical protein
MKKYVDMEDNSYILKLCIVENEEEDGIGG